MMEITNLNNIKENKNNSLKYLNGLLKEKEKKNFDESKIITENSDSEEKLEYFSE